MNDCQYLMVMHFKYKKRQKSKKKYEDFWTKSLPSKGAIRSFDETTLMWMKRFSPRFINLYRKAKIQQKAIN